MKTSFFQGLVFLCCVLLSPDAHSAPSERYHVTDLGTLPGGSYPATAFAINNIGQIAGQARASNGLNRPFLYEDGTMRELPAGTNEAIANLLNGRGQVLGTFATDHDPLTTGRDHSFLFSKGIVVDLSVVHGGFIQPFGINNLGHFVGIAEEPDGSVRSFICREGAIRFLGFAIQAEVHDINDTGLMVGIGFYPSSNLPEPSLRATIFQNGNHRDLGLLTDSISTHGLSINSHADAVGYATLSNQQARAFVYIKGRMLEVGTLPGHVSSYLWSINDSRVAVGISRTSDGQGRAILWQNGQLEDLNDLISPGADWTLQNAHAINDHGQIVGVGSFKGEAHPFLLTPLKRRK